LPETPAGAIFEHDRLEVYQNALSFLTVVDQLHRAALSVVAYTRSCGCPVE
jgi:hypothetical protein